jgi:hypothetical protein
MLTAREEIVYSYEKILSGSHSKNGMIMSGGMEQLPPFLCHKMIFGESFNNFPKNLNELFTGERSSILKSWKNDEACLFFLIGSTDFPFQFDLPLDGIELAKETLKKWSKIKSILDVMKIEDTNRLHYMLKWTSLIIWVQLKQEKQKVDLLTSSSFPDLPHTTFISDKALKHIPPNIIFDSDCDYALKENLYHESLHQELAALLLHNNILSSEYSASTSKKVLVPWRNNAAWEPDRVLHAIYVYSNILPMRFEYLNKNLKPDVKETLSSALSEGIGALSFLSDHMQEFKWIFTVDGKKVLKSIMAKAKNVLTTLK